jgi:carbon monoxide dehydrogenase subunit G
MRFSGERQVPAAVGAVWAGLHDPTVLRTVVPGCVEMSVLGDGRYAATLQARVGRIADSYRGTFSVADVEPGSELRVRVQAAGRFGRLEVDLYVRLTAGSAGATSLRYDAEAVVGGLVSRLGGPALTVAGGHFTAAFFRDLDHVVATVQERSAPTR